MGLNDEPETLRDALKDVEIKLNALNKARNSIPSRTKKEPGTELSVNL